MQNNHATWKRSFQVAWFTVILLKLLVLHLAILWAGKGVLWRITNTITTG
jgi:uncharacterized membrane protein YsdA (DUF1294 family)